MYSDHLRDSCNVDCMFDVRHSTTNRNRFIVFFFYFFLLLAELSSSQERANYWMKLFLGVDLFNT